MPSRDAFDDNPFAAPVSDLKAAEESSSLGHVVFGTFWQRFVAVFVDGIISQILLMILGGVVGAIIGATMGTGAENVARIAGGLIGLIGGWLYYALQESSEAQATLGKRMMSLKVTTLTGGRISFGQATGRYFAKIISGLILGIGYFMQPFTEKKQALHDIMAGTLVIKG